MLTMFSTTTVRKAAAQRRERKSKTKSTLAVETLDKRRMLTTWSAAYPSTSLWSMPQTRSAYSLPASWSMPTSGTYGSYSSNTFGSGTSLSGMFSSPRTTTYSTSSFLPSSSYFAPTVATSSWSAVSTPAFSSSSPYGTSYASSNVYTTRPGSTFYGTYSPSISSNSGSSWASSTAGAIANLQSSYDTLRQLNTELQHMGGTPVGVPSSVTSTLNNFSGVSLGGPRYSASLSTTPYRGPSEIVLSPRTDSRTSTYSPDVGDRMIRSSTERLFGSGGMVDAVKRTSEAISRSVQPAINAVNTMKKSVVNTYVTPAVNAVQRVSSAFGGRSFVGSASRR